MKILWPLLAVTLALLWLTTPAAAQTAYTDSPPLKMSVTETAPYGLSIENPTGEAWMRFKTSYCDPQEGHDHQGCMFAGMEVWPGDHPYRGNPLRLYASPLSDSWDMYGAGGCISWNQVGLTSYCGPNGQTLITQIGDIKIMPNRALEVVPGPGYPIWLKGQVGIGPPGCATTGRILDVCDAKDQNVIARIGNYGKGGSVLELISANYAGSATVALSADGTLSLIAKRVQACDETGLVCKTLTTP